MFRLFVEGDQGSGLMGVKAIASWTNSHVYRKRVGATWGIGPLHALLTNPVYAGRMRFNRQEARTGRRMAENEHVFAEVPAIIEPALFAKVQTLRRQCATS